MIMKHLYIVILKNYIAIIYNLLIVLLFII